MKLERHSDSNFIPVQSSDASLSYVPYFKGLASEQEPVRLYYSVDDGTGILEHSFTSNPNGKYSAIIPH